MWRKIFQSVFQTKRTDPELILETIANEYLDRRLVGDSMDEIRDALYGHFSVAKPVEFWIGYYNPIPFGNLMFAGQTKRMPEDALALGEIAYTIFCHNGIYPRPREGQGPRDSACEYDTMSKICRKCKVQMAVFEATGKKVDPSLWEMMKSWSALDQEIGAANATWEETLESASHEPETRDTRDRIEGVPPSEGLFGTKWLMPMEQVLDVVPRPELRYENKLTHSGNYHGRRASFSYHFKDSLLAEIWVCLNDSSEKDFNRTQAYLSAEFGLMPPPVVTEMPWKGRASNAQEL